MKGILRQLNEVYNMLADDESKDTYECVVERYLLENHENMIKLLFDKYEYARIERLELFKKNNNCMHIQKYVIAGGGKSCNYNI